MFKVCDRRTILIFVLVVGSVVLGALPFIGNLYLFFFLMFLQGLVGGTIDVSVNAWVLDIWGEGCSTYMQALHCSYGIGMTVAPFYVTPFLGLIPARDDEKSLLVEPTHLTKEEYAEKLHSFELVFILSGVVIMIVAIIQTVLLLVENSKMKRVLEKFEKDQNGNRMSLAVNNFNTFSQTSQPIEATTTTTSSTQSLLTDYEQKLVIGIGAFILFIYVGMEVNSLTFITEYLYYLGYDTQTGGNQASITNTSFAIGRFLGILFSFFLTSDRMIIINLSMIVTGSFILLFLSNVSLTWITIGLSLFGAGCSVIFPCLYSMIEERTKLTTFSVGLLMFAGSIASVIYPLIVPSILGAHPMIYAYNNVVSILLVVSAVIYLMRRFPK